MRYQITERVNPSAPQPSDPKAQAFKRHSGVFDLNDTLRGTVIGSPTRDLRKLRVVQAAMNSGWTMEGVI